MKFKKERKSDNYLKKWTLILMGCFFTALGILGIFLPLLPTTPFLLMSAACFIRSSEKLYNWLIGNKWLGQYIKHYLERKGISLELKIFSLVLLWITIGYSVFFVIGILYVRVILCLIAIGVSIHLFSIRTLKKK